MMLPSAAALAAIGGYAGWTLGRGSAGDCVRDCPVRPLRRMRTHRRGADPPAAARAHQRRPSAAPADSARACSTSRSRCPRWPTRGSCLRVWSWSRCRSASPPRGTLASRCWRPAAGLLLLVALVGLTQLVTSAVHLIIRDRRRAELFGLVIVVFFRWSACCRACLAPGRHHRPPHVRDRARPSGGTSSDGGRTSAARPWRRSLPRCMPGRSRSPPAGAHRRASAAVAALGGLRWRCTRSRWWPSGACSARRAPSARRRGTTSETRLADGASRPRHWRCPRSPSISCGWRCARRAAAPRCCRRSWCSACSRR